MLAVHRHDLVAQLVRRRVKRHGESHRSQLRELIHLVREAARGHRDAAARNAIGVIVEEQTDRGHHSFQILEGFAHAHQHDVRDHALIRIIGSRFAPQFAFSPEELAHDFGGLQVAGKTLFAGRAEEAAHRAARLRRNAERTAVHFRDIHRLNGVAVADIEGPLAGAVGGNLFTHRFRRTDFSHRLQLLAEGLREIRHLAEVTFKVAVDPSCELDCPERFFPEAVTPPGELLPIKIKEIHSLCRH